MAKAGNTGDGALNASELGRTPDSILVWHHLDPEARLGFKAGRFTDANAFLSAIVGMFFTGITFAGMCLVRDSMVGQVFLNRGPVQYVITFLTYWSLSILFFKLLKLRVQRRPLQLMIVPQSRDFVLAPRTAQIVLRRMDSLVDNPKHFILLNRIELALSNLSNIGRISDVSDILVTQAGNDEDRMVSSYSLMKGFVWAIPVFGFIGTVLGLSTSIGGFTNVMAQAKDISQLTAALRGVTGGLSTAFDTTLLGLLAAVTVQLLLTWLVKKEEDFLHECQEYCHLYIVGRLRLVDPGEDSDASQPEPPEAP